MDTLKDIMAKLREPDGCPWDLEQDHMSLRTYLIEEVYEVIDAIEKNDDKLLIEELGDLLLQIVFHCRIAEEEERFSIEDVISNVSEKLIRRHPHVFGNSTAEDSEAVLQRWEKIKLDEGKTDILAGLPHQLPSLLKAYRIISKLERMKEQFQFKDEYSSIKEKIDSLNGHDEKEDYISETLFNLCILAKKNNIDPELALYGKCRDIINNYRDNISVK